MCIVRLPHFCNMFRASLQQKGIFATCVGHFCNIVLRQHDPVLRWGIFPSTTSSLLSDEEEVKCEASIYLAMGRYLAKLYFMTTKNDCSSAAACFVGKCSFCLDILNVTSLKS